LNLYPKKFGYSLGGYSHRERCRAPIERSRQKKGEKLKPMIKNQLVDKWFRRNRLHFVSNELRLHCRQNKHRVLSSGAIYES
jgi:hypothetical protein